MYSAIWRKKSSRCSSDVNLPASPAIFLSSAWASAESPSAARSRMSHFWKSLFFGSCFSIWRRTAIAFPANPSFS